MHIVAKDLTVSLGGRMILAGESVVCSPGQTTALVGPSGSGKTTLLHCLGLLLPVGSGHLSIDGHDVSKASDRQRREFWRDDAAFVLQDYGIIEDESVEFNVTLRSRRRIRKVSDLKLTDALRRAGLEERARDPAHVLSGGEKQRLALARAVYRDARGVFVDEPTASLDEGNRRLIIVQLLELAAEGCTVVVATHDRELIEMCSAHHEVRREEVQGESSTRAKTDGQSAA